MTACGLLRLAGLFALNCLLLARAEDAPEAPIERGADFPGLAKLPAEILSALPEWSRYLQRSLAAKERDDAFARQEQAAHPLPKESMKPAKGKSHSFDANRPDEWYASPAGQAVTASIISFQSPNGGWSKSIDFSKGPRLPGQRFGPETSYVSTFDNGATIPQLRHLARTRRLTGDAKASASFLIGLEFVFNSQYPNGGWPQIWPLRGGYHDCVTFNDNAMVNTMALLADIRQGSPDFEWLPAAERQRAVQSLEAAIQCVLDSQIRSENQLLGWSQQYHPLTLTPAPARAFEMISLSSAESAGIVDFLITLEDPSPEIVAAIEGAVAWMRSSAINGYAFIFDADRQRQLVADADAKPLWPRFLEIGTNRPLFGDRDGAVHTEIALISEERRNGYAWFTTNPGSAIRRYEKWQARRAN